MNHKLGKKNKHKIKTNGVRAIAVLFVGALLLGSLPFAAAAGNVKTAQSAMIDLQVPEGTSLSIINDQVWSFSKDTASTFYSNAWNEASPTVSCVGNPANCANTNQPAAPSVPAIDPIPTSTINGDRCTFWNGGTLSSGTYTKSVTINGLNGKGNWQFTYTYNFGGDTVAPQTAWTMIQDNTVTPTVNILAKIMSLSVLEKTNLWKSSFTLLNSDGTPRIANLELVVTAPDGTTVLDHIYTPDEIAVLTQLDSTGAAIDFLYSANAGTNGQTGILANNAPASSIVNGLSASADGKYDNFLGNNYDPGPDGVIGTSDDVGSPAIARADIAAQQLTLDQVGAYTITMTGTIKESIDGALRLPISTTSIININAENCAQ